MNSVDAGMAARLKWARETKFEDASEAARAMQVSIPTYLGHENGSRGFRRHIIKYASFFGVSPTWLLTGHGEPYARSLQRRIEQLPREKIEELDRFLSYLESKQ